MEHSDECMRLSQENLGVYNHFKTFQICESKRTLITVKPIPFPVAFAFLEVVFDSKYPKYFKNAQVKFVERYGRDTMNNLN